MKADNQFPFSKTRLEAIKPPARGRRYTYDTKVAGLALCTTSAGSKSFYIYRWHAGRPVRMKLGPFPTMSVEEAQKQARVLVGEMARGLDPQAARMAANHEQTLRGLWEFWWAHAKARGVKSLPEHERMFNVFLKPWAGRRLSSVKKSDVQALHARIGRENGPYIANRLVGFVQAMFNRAPDMGYRGDNPANRVERFKENKRDRFLQGDELPRFFRALLEEPSEMLRDYFILSLLLGARSANMAAMAWADVDLQSRFWRIPEMEAKAGVPIVLPLAPEAAAILEARRQNANGPWVFPGRGKSGHLVEGKFAWKRIIERAGLVDVRPHDLRRTYASWQAIGGSSLPIIGKSLGHSTAAATSIYARLSMAPVRDSVGAATDAMLAAGGLIIDVQGMKLLSNEKEEHRG
jgi:integrase